MQKKKTKYKNSDICIDILDKTLDTSKNIDKNTKNEEFNVGFNGN